MPFPDTNATKNLRDLPSILLQKFPDEQFKVTTKLTFTPSNVGDKISLIVWGNDYAYLNLVKKMDLYKDISHYNISFDQPIEDQPLKIIFFVLH